MQIFEKGKYLKYILVTATYLILACSSEPNESARPNILFIMSDDHAMQAISAYGHPISQLAPDPKHRFCTHIPGILRNRGS